MADYTFEWYKNMVMARRIAEPHQRRGQYAFNLLFQVRPDIANEFRATELDPFHRDHKLPDWLNAVEAAWDDDDPTWTDEDERANPLLGEVKRAELWGGPTE
jgi:hypothetical protein